MILENSGEQFPVVLKVSTGMYNAGFFPVMMFGLPGAALAMYRCARKENKKKVGAILIFSCFGFFLQV